jgi:hypothetical protein
MLPPVSSVSTLLSRTLVRFRHEMSRCIRGTLCVPVLVLLLCCVGCGKKARLQRATAQLSGEPATATSEAIIDDIKLVDVSIPIGVSVYETGGAPDGVMMAHYESKFSVDMLADFYHLDMERLGWQEHASFPQYREMLMLFEKPYRWCVVSMRATSRGTDVSLYIRQKSVPPTPR